MNLGSPSFSFSQFEVLEKRTHLIQGSNVIHTRIRQLNSWANVKIITKGILIGKRSRKWTKNKYAPFTRMICTYASAYAVPTKPWFLGRHSMWGSHNQYCTVTSGYNTSVSFCRVHKKEDGPSLQTQSLY